ncbi:MAG: DUF5131 family protein [Desulfurococcaceae archaeon]
MSLDKHILRAIELRLKKVGRAARRNPVGRMYVPSGLVGKHVAYVTEEELNDIRREIERLRSIKSFTEHLFNSRNHSRMFSVVSDTWNPVTGCTHNCVYCWARQLAETKLRNSRKYRDGFSPRIHGEEFKKKFSGGVVFVSDMGDLFCSGVPDEWVLKVLRHVRKFPNTYFLFLTKSPSRYLDFINEFPPNSVLGATIETDSDELFMKHSPRISQAPLPSIRYGAMKKLEWPMKFISIEPILDFNLDRFTEWIRDINPFMVYVGYDNYGHKLPEPAHDKTLKLMERLSEFTLVVKKTVRPAWYEATSPYRYSEQSV